MDAKRKILVADDEKEIRDFLNLLLTNEGYEVTCVSNGSEVLEKNDDSIDLFLLDVNMPGLDGFTVASMIRKKYDTPIIFLTAYSAESDKFMGFSIGADDYVVKPFSNIELLMRIKARLKSKNNNQLMPSSNKNIKMIKDLILDTDRQIIVKDEKTVPLTYTEYKILELLANNPKKIFSLDEIYQCIWNDNAVGDEAIMVHIKNIRKKLNDVSKNSKYIKTAWGRGYYID